MSIFHDNGIIIKIIKWTEKDDILQVFFQNYGILSVKNTKNKRKIWMDIWNLISAEIYTRSENSLATLQAVKVLSYIPSDTLNYKSQLAFLEYITDIKTYIPLWYPHYESFQLSEKLLQIWKTLRYQDILLARLKLREILWEGWELVSNKVFLRKIQNFLRSYDTKYIFQLTSLSEEQIQSLEKILSKKT